MVSLRFFRRNKCNVLWQPLGPLHGNAATRGADGEFEINGGQACQESLISEIKADVGTENVKSPRRKYFLNSTLDESDTVH